MGGSTQGFGSWRRVTLRGALFDTFVNALDKYRDKQRLQKTYSIISIYNIPLVSSMLTPLYRISNKHWKHNSRILILCTAGSGQCFFLDSAHTVFFKILHLSSFSFFLFLLLHFLFFYHSLLLKHKMPATVHI